MVRKKQTVDHAASKSDVLVDSTVTVNPNHMDYEEEWLQHIPFSSEP